MTSKQIKILLFIAITLFVILFLGQCVSKTIHKWKIQRQTQTMLKQAEEQAKLNQARTQALIAEMQRKDAENKVRQAEIQKQAQEKAEQSKLKAEQERKAAEEKAKIEADKLQRIAQENEERERKEAEQRQLLQQQEEELRTNIPLWKSEVLKKTNEQLSEAALAALKETLPENLLISLSPRAKETFSRVKLLLKNQPELASSIKDGDLAKALKILNQSYDGSPYKIFENDLDRQLYANGTHELMETTKEAVEKAGDDIVAGLKPRISSGLLQALTGFTSQWNLELTPATDVDMSPGWIHRFPKFEVIAIQRDANSQDKLPVRRLYNSSFVAPGPEPKSFIFGGAGDPASPPSLSSCDLYLVVSKTIQIRTNIPSPPYDKEDVADTRIVYEELLAEYSNEVKLARAQNQSGAISEKDAKERIVKAWKAFQEKGRALCDKF